MAPERGVSGALDHLPDESPRSAPTIIARMALMSPGRRMAALYLSIQAGLGIVWWAILLLRPQSRAAFQPREYPSDFILTYALPDGLLFIGASGATAILLLRRSPAARLALWFTAGAVMYATLHCIGIALRTTGFWPSAIMMAASAACTLAIAALFRHDDGDLPRVPFRALRVRTGRAALARTLTQMSIFWVLFFGLMPWGLLVLERSLGVTGFMPQPIAGAVVFVAFGCIGLWSAFTMSLRGMGTPLPNQCASRLVTAGPYRFVRNPMAVAGVVQVGAIGLGLGSWFVLGYGLAGGAMWQICLKPAEEADLANRFGEEYERYRRRVRCWWPIPRTVHAAMNVVQSG